MRGECVTDGAAAPYREGMRYLAAALVLAACASDPAPATDASTDLGAPADVGVDTGPADTGIADAGPTVDTPAPSDAGPGLDAGDTGTDVVRVDGAPCIPACAAGSVCVGGVCETVDGGADAGAVDGGADAGPAQPPAREAREFQSCEPPGTSCGGDAVVTCVRSEWLREDAGPRGACLRSCTVGAEGQCPAGSQCFRGLCVILCSSNGDCGDAGTRCVPYSIDTACL